MFRAILFMQTAKNLLPRHYTISAEEGEPLTPKCHCRKRGNQGGDWLRRRRGETLIKSIPICDVQLVHRSRVSDDEPSRFLLPVTVFGRELGQHSGGKRFNWGNKTLQLINGLRMQLVNVGPTSQVDAGKGTVIQFAGFVDRVFLLSPQIDKKMTFLTNTRNGMLARKTFVFMQILYQMS